MKIEPKDLSSEGRVATTVQYLNNLLPLSSEHKGIPVYGNPGIPVLDTPESSFSLF